MYKCKLCNYKVKTIPDKCPNCGGSGDSIWVLVPKPLLILEGNNNNEIVVFEDRKVFNQATFKIFGIEIYQYISGKEQFVIFYDEEKEEWKIRGNNSVVNPTIVDGENINGKERSLSNGKTIKVGPLELIVNIK